MSAKKILVVDDEEQVQEMMHDLFKTRGYEVIQARTGREAIALAKSSLPDLILLDIIIPEPDGFAVQLALKSHPATKSIPVVFITAKTDLQDTMNAMTQGAQGYIEKPFDLKRLLRKVESLLPKS